jgi:transcriptional regulator with XRE-family HTH domain
METNVNITDRVEIGTRIKAKRKELGLTQRAVADALHIDRTALTKIETANRAITAEEVMQFAEIFGVSCDWLLGRTRAQAPDDFIQEALNRYGLSETALGSLEDMATMAESDVEQLAWIGSRVLGTLDTFLTTDLGRVTLVSIGAFLFNDFQGYEAKTPGGGTRTVTPEEEMSLALQDLRGAILNMRKEIERRK